MSRAKEKLHSKSEKPSFWADGRPVVILSIVYGIFLFLVLVLSERFEVVAPFGFMLVLTGATVLSLRYHLIGAAGSILMTLLALGISQLTSVGYFAAREPEQAWLIAFLFWLLVGVQSIMVAIATGYMKRSIEIETDRELLLERIFDSLPIGIWLRGSSGRTLLVNQHWADFSGQTVEDIRSNGPAGALAELGAEWEEFVDSVVSEGGKGIHYQRIELKNKNGSEYRLNLVTLGIYIDEEESIGTLSLLIDETALRLSEEKVRISEKRLRSALTSATIGIWDRDHVTEEIYCDENWYRILGVENPSEAVDPLQLWNSLIHPDDKPQVIDAYDAFFDEHEDTIQIDYRLQLPSGGYRWVHDRLSVLERTPHGEVKRSMGTLLDITERKQVENVLKDSKERAESASVAKDYFIATVSHEIRTPLNAIIGLSRFLEESELDEEQLDLVQTINTSGRSLLALVNDILDFSKIETGHLDLETQEFSLKICLRDCVRLFRLRAAEKGIEIRLEIDDSIEEFVFGDMERLRQVVQNLVANGIKFTDNGKIIIKARRVELEDLAPERRPDRYTPLGYLDQADHEYIEVLVEDSGIGIPEAQQRELFEAFSQVDASATRRYEGTGLGLAICKRLVLAMGGRIWVDSQEGTGSCFGFVARIKFIEKIENNTDPITRSPFEPFLPIAEEHPCDLLIVGSGKVTDRLLFSCRKLGYVPHHSTEYNLDNELFMRRHYDLIMIVVDDTEAALELSHKISSGVSIRQPQEIIAIVPEEIELTIQKAKSVGIDRRFGERPTPPVIRELILDALSAHD
ncbi:MAG: ATP-binding protein [Verrucomicrobiota bacterium]